MTLFCSSSSDDDVSVRQSSVALDPHELLSRHPCRRDSGLWQRVEAGYDVVNDDDGRKTLTSSPVSAARRYVGDEAVNNCKVSIAT